MPDATTQTMGTQTMDTPGTSPAQTQQSCPAPEQPGAQHRWLQRMVGTWRFEGECPAPDGQGAGAFSGRETVRGLSNLWIVGEGENAMPDGTAMTTLLTLGYDPAGEAFVGSFLCSTFTHLWRYRGRLEDDGKTLVLDTEGPSMEGDGLTAYQDIVTLEDDDHRTLRSRMKAGDGTWKQVVELRYSRED